MVDARNAAELAAGGEQGKKYSSQAAMNKAFTNFQNFLVMVDARNAAELAAGGEQCHGLTQFADLSQGEFADTYLMKPGYYVPRVHNETSFVRRVGTQAGNVDWRSQGVVTPVKNQAQCGSCWAFSATEAMESYSAIAKLYYGGTMIPCSTEQSCSCTYVYNGCNGGNPQNVYKTAVQNYNGEESEADYSYTMNCANCGVKSTVQKYIDNSGYTNAPSMSLQTTLATGPPSVCVAAESWNTYKGGVMTNCAGSIDHCVQAVGYTNSGVTQAYWVVRNSWGVTWGIQGYIYLAMAGDTCQVQSDINYPHAMAVPAGRR